MAESDSSNLPKVPWKEDKEQTNMQRFQISPANDLVRLKVLFYKIYFYSNVTSHIICENGLSFGPNSIQ
jgi:hypothetical protein